MVDTVKRILVSACLLGVRCRYTGEGCLNADVLCLSNRYVLIPICPEQLGGMPTPRVPSEIVDGSVMDRGGNDVTECLQMGAEEALRIAMLTNCSMAVLKARSPSCGFGEVYDGTFSGRLTKGCGITAGLLAENGIRVISEEALDCLD